MEQFKSLTMLAEGEDAIIHHIDNMIIANKLYSMGVLPGRRVKLVRKAPLGGGFYLKIVNQNMALRMEEARSIMLAND